MGGGWGMEGGWEVGGGWGMGGGWEVGGGWGMEGGGRWEGGGVSGGGGWEAGSRLHYPIGLFGVAMSLRSASHTPKQDWRALRDVSPTQG